MGENVDGFLPWQVRIRPQDVGRSYGEVFCELVMDPNHPVLPLGILRQSETCRPYVWTNTSSNARLRSSDLMYVLGDSRFGKYAFSMAACPSLKLETRRDPRYLL